MKKIPTGQHTVMAKLVAGQRIHQNTSTNQYRVGSPEKAWVSILRSTFQGLHTKGFLKVAAIINSDAGYVISREYDLSREGYRWCSANLDWTLGPDASEPERNAYQKYTNMLTELNQKEGDSDGPA